MNLFRKLKEFFSEEQKAGEIGKETSSGEKVRIASCALLLEAAMADGEIDDKEKSVILKILEEDFGLSEGDARTLINVSGEEKQNSIDLYRFTKMVDKNLSYDEKFDVLVNIWKVIFADGRLDKYEDQLIHRIANLLKVSHKELIDAKMEAKKIY